MRKSSFFSIKPKTRIISRGEKSHEEKFRKPSQKSISNTPKEECKKLPVGVGSRKKKKKKTQNGKTPKNRFTNPGTASSQGNITSQLETKEVQEGEWRSCGEKGYRRKPGSKSNVEGLSSHNKSIWGKRKFGGKGTKRGKKKCFLKKGNQLA